MRVTRHFFGWVHGAALALGVLAVGCDRNEAKPVVYLEIDSLTLQPDASRGTSSAHVRSVWVESEGTYFGVFPLPARIPLPVSNPNARVRLYPGVEVNGISSFQAQYEFYQPYERELGGTYGATVKWPPATPAVLAYEPWANVVILEDFEAAGIQLAPSPRSDTVWTRTSAERFPPPMGESNSSSGMVIMRPGQQIFEAITQLAYDLPGGGKNVYLEFNYKSTMPFSIGVIANQPGQTTQQPTVTFRDKKTWSKAYVNLVTEVSGFPNATDFNLYLGAVRTRPDMADTLWVDNLKLVYR
jgi:hypothetical protein